MAADQKKKDLFDVLDTLGIEYRMHGNYGMACCPFHHDRRPSMRVTANCYYCYACGEHGGVNKFVRVLLNVSAEEAAKWLKDKGVKTSYRPVEHNDKKVLKADRRVLNLCYAALLESTPLTYEDRKELTGPFRNVPEANLRQYCSMDHVYEDGLIREIALRVLRCITKHDEPYTKMEKQKGQRTFDQLIELIRTGHIPGFYYDGKTVSVRRYKGIGIACRDAEGYIVGMQVRIRKPKDGAKYVWLSSGSHGGASSGTMSGVVFPSPASTRKAVVCITEGRFKAEAIAQKGNIAIYLSGVSTWKCCLDNLKKVIGNRKRVYIMFDSDLMGNPMVAENMMHLSEELIKMELTPVIVLWPLRRGKGFDDLVSLNINDDYTGYLTYLDYPRFKAVYENVRDHLLKEHGVEKYVNLSSDSVADFKNQLQEMEEKYLLK